MSYVCVEEVVFSIGVPMGEENPTTGKGPQLRVIMMSLKPENAGHRMTSTDKLPEGWIPNGYPTHTEKFLYFHIPALVKGEPEVFATIEKFIEDFRPEVTKATLLYSDDDEGQYSRSVIQDLSNKLRALPGMETEIKHHIHWNRNGSGPIYNDFFREEK